ncbi:hypothetical protein BC829DRAFT_180753 [Chytridium lagenaria]|nr:hypothetical protein BC829DRAFT_180753 [Chytridium lagenaria]
MLSRSPSSSPTSSPETTTSEKRFHVFISYRVKTDAALAERISDKLRSRIVEAAKVNSNLKDVHFQVFLDKQSLVAGEGYRNQFLGALKSSCLVVPIISAPSLAIFEAISEDSEDNVLAEWEAALDLNSKGNVDILPLLIGTNADQGAYNRFSAFSTSSIPNITPLHIKRSARSVIADMLAIQGLFVDPSDLEERLSILCERFASNIWSKYRHLWHDQDCLAPESFSVCVQCGTDYRESQNAAGVVFLSQVCASHVRRCP